MLHPACHNYCGGTKEGDFLCDLLALAQHACLYTVSQPVVSTSQLERAATTPFQLFHSFEIEISKDLWSYFVMNC